jgi:hypothetical protein
VLTTYLKQRVRPTLIIALAAFLFLFGRPVSTIGLGSLSIFVFVIAFLIVFRLYDDLQQAGNDIGKHDRCYTDPLAKKTLGLFLIAFVAALVGYAAMISKTFACLLLGFIAVNHVLYLGLVKYRTAAAFLPLLKYPFLFILLQYTGPAVATLDIALVFPAISLFIGFVAFESIDDEEFPVSLRYAYVLQFLSLLFILAVHVSTSGAFWFAVLFIISASWTFFRLWARAYMFFVCLLSFKLIVENL